MHHKTTSCATAILLILSFGTGIAIAQTTATYENGRFYDDFSGAPASPEAWYSSDWDRTVHVRSRDQYYEMYDVDAQHGVDCSGPPNTHLVNTYEDSIFRCRNHVMTAISAPDYGLIELMPRYLVDFSEGEAIVRFNLSTLRQSGRDWVDIFLSPFEEHLQLPVDHVPPDLQGGPRNAVNISMGLIRSNTKFRGRLVEDFEATKLDGTADSWRGYEYFLTPDAARRDTFELRISKTHIRFGMPEHDFWWFDEDIPELSWDKAVLQFGHHSYTPTKDCDHDGTCGPTTWHWDDVSIEPAVPFTMIHGTPRYADETNAGTIQFERPAPPDALVRFMAIGTDLELSFDGGSNWTPAVRQAQERDVEGHFSSYLSPIPTGAQSVTLRGNDWWGGYWHARSFSVVSLFSDVSLPVELGSFTASADGPDAVLEWTTLSETDNAGFGVEQEVDGEFVELSFVPGAGTTTSPRDYSFQIGNLEPGTNRFRLRQVDLDGASIYSRVVQVEIGAPGDPMISEVYPNPATGAASLTITPSDSGPIRVELVDVLGRIVGIPFDGEVPAGAQQLVRLDMEGLPAGVYFSRVTGFRLVESRAVHVR